MRKTIILASLIMLTSCENETKPEDTTRYKERYIYLKDSQNRCLKIDTNVYVYGIQNSQSGDIIVRIVPENLPCME